MTDRRYLPLISDSDGSWINRPDYYLLARMGAHDQIEPEEVFQVYEIMVRSSASMQPLNSLEVQLKKAHVEAELRFRVFSGQVLLEMVRIAASTRQPPKVAQAIRLVALNHYEMFRKSSAESQEREVRRGFSMFRDTAHLQAAMVLGQPSINEIENSERGTTLFLARARGFELFVDNNIEDSRFKWNPWRVPENIIAEPDIEVAQLTDKERMIALKR